MAQIQCKSCGGVYVDVLPDGVRYFHACPPLSAPELAAAVAAGKVVLPSGETVEDAVARRTYKRRQKRDENVVASRDPTQPATIKAHGKGVTVLGPSPVGNGGVVVDV